MNQLIAGIIPRISELRRRYVANASTGRKKWNEKLATLQFCGFAFQNGTVV
jgi:hypothetical protein